MASGGGGGDGGSGLRQEQEEGRKANLRSRIDALYGITPAEIPRPEKLPPPPNSGRFGAGIGGQLSQDAYNENLAMRNQAVDAGAAMDAENTKLAEATRQYYTDQLGDQFGEAERKTRFRLARQGLLGGSEDVNQQSDVKQDRDLGATRVDEAVRRSIAGLTSQREQERLNAISLANSGAGDSAVSAAHAGLRNSFENVASQSRADLFGDLFTNAADSFSANNMANNEAAIAARYRDRLGSFFPTSRSSSGRVTPSQ